MIIEKKKHSISSIFIMLLLVNFIFMAVLIINYGSSIYKETTAQMEANYQHRTCMAYLTQKIRMYDSKDMIAIKQYDNCPVLCLYQYANDIEYVTYLYEYDGYLYEYLTRAELDFSFEFGDKIIEINNLCFDFIKDNLLEISFIDADNLHQRLLVCIHSREDIYV